jgi:glycosyltransferase involved in cell wall biosynthesis
MTRDQSSLHGLEDATMDHDPGIVFVIDLLPPQGGGMEKALTLVAQELAMDMPVLIIVLSGPALPPEALGAGIECVYLHVRPGLTRLLRSVVPLRRALRQRSGDAQNIVAVGVWCTTVLSWARRWNMNGCVIWEHSVTHQRLMRSRKMRLLWALARPAVRRAEVVVCVSEPVRKEAELVSGRTRRVVVVIPNMLSAERPPETVGSGLPGGEGVQVLGVGALSPVKSWQTAIRAMNYLPGRVTLQIAGEGPELATLSRLAEDLGLAARVTFLGYHDDVATLLATSDVLVHPSRSETFGYALLEAAEAHVPVVVRDYPVMNQLVPRYVAGVVSGDDPQDFAAAIEQATRFHRDSEVWVRTATVREREFGRAHVAQLWRGLLSEPQRATALPGSQA